MDKIKDQITTTKAIVQNLESTFDGQTWTSLCSLFARVARLGRVAALVKQLLMVALATGAILVIGGVFSEVHLYIRERQQPLAASKDKTQPTSSPAPTGTSATRENLSRDASLITTTPASSKFCGQYGARIRGKSEYCEECGARLV